MTNILYDICHRHTVGTELKNTVVTSEKEEIAMQLLTVKNIHTHNGFTPGYFIFKQGPLSFSLAY